MADVPNTAVAAILTVMVIVVVALLMYTLVPETFQQVSSIADNVLFADEIAKEEVESLTAASSKQFFDDMNTCDDEQNSECFCVVRTRDIPSGSFFVIDNKPQGKGMTVTTLTEEQTPLAQEDYEYQMGLLILHDLDDKGLRKDLACVFPDQFQIVGTATGSWSVQWQGKEWKLYKDKTESESSHVSSLKTAPLIYREEENKYCLLTDLIEKESVDITGAVEYEVIGEIEVKTASIFGYEYPTVTNWEQIYDFFNTEKRAECSFQNSSSALFIS